MLSGAMLRAGAARVPIFASAVAARAFSTSMAQRGPIKNVVVFGSGQMGGGIGMVAAQSGYNVTLVDMSEDILSKNMDAIKTSLTRMAKKKAKSPEEEQNIVKETMGRISTSTDGKAAVQDSDLVIEAIVENLGVKQKLFAELDAVAPAKTIFASNTSSLQITDIAKDVKRKEKFAGLHFFNPVAVMKLIEVVQAHHTSDETKNALVEFGTSLGKRCVECKDTPGFIVNRLLVPYIFEGVRMFERGEATMQDIDAGMKLGAGYPMGPFELADYVGLDTLKFIMDGWCEKHPEEPGFKPSPLVNRLVAEGHLGKKSKQGFYKY